MGRPCRTTRSASAATKQSFPSCPPSSSPFSLASTLTRAQESSVLLPLTQALSLYTQLPAEDGQLAAIHSQVGSFCAWTWTRQWGKKGATFHGPSALSFHQAFGFYKRMRRDGGSEGGRGRVHDVVDCDGAGSFVGGGRSCRRCTGGGRRKGRGRERKTEGREGKGGSVY